MGITGESIAAFVIAVLAFVLLCGIITIVVFICLKVHDFHKRINKLEEELEQLRLGLGQNKIDGVYEVTDETAVFRYQGKDDSAIDVRGSSFGNRDSYCDDDEWVVPTMTFEIEKDIAHVLNNHRPDSQVVAIAQNYHKERTKSKNVVGIDQMKITTGDRVKGFVPDSIKRNTIYEGRPTSMLLDLSSPTSESECIYEEGIFVHKMLTKSGGTLDILGIKLIVPSGALEKDTQITLGVTWHPSVLPQMSKQGALLSPVVVCQPSIEFKKPVSLSFPHCAMNVEHDWQPAVWYRENNLHDTDTEWKELKPSDVHKYEICKSRVVLELKHFTLYTLTGQSIEGKTAVKAVKLLAFTSPFQMDKMFTVRMYCINNYDPDSSEMKALKASAAVLKEKPADTLQPMFVQDNGEDILVKLAKVSQGWNIDGHECQSIDFESIWHCLLPSCKFLFHPSDHEDKVRKIVCEFNYNQKPSEKVRTIKVAEEQIQFSPLALRDNLGPEQKLMQKMILMLDPQSDNDYKILAGKIGYDYLEIKWLETQPSPTETLLEKWIGNGRSLTDLKDYLIDMERLDVVSTLNQA